MYIMQAFMASIRKCNTGEYVESQIAWGKKLPVTNA